MNVHNTRLISHFWKVEKSLSRLQLSEILDGVCLLSAGLWSPVSLPSILEPVADLHQRQTSFLRQRALLLQCRVKVAPVAVLECLPRSLLETVDRLLTVPDCPRQRVLAPQPVLVHGAYHIHITLSDRQPKPIHQSMNKNVCLHAAFQ